MTFDIFAAPIALQTGRRLAQSALPNAPVVVRRARRAA
jgi:hypothetical protein